MGDAPSVAEAHREALDGILDLATSASSIPSAALLGLFKGAFKGVWD